MNRNLAVQALGGKKGLYSHYPTLKPGTINRILAELEFSGRVNNNVGLVIEALGLERNKRSRNLNALMVRIGNMGIKTKKYKRPTLKRKSNNLSAALSRMKIKQTTTFKKK
jgi:hypothetical protein